jgi:uncharacterized protein YlxW (UPF0749 family)
MAITDRDFGQLEAEVRSLQKEVAELRADVKALLELANKGKGGFWMGMTIASIIGGVITHFGGRFIK